MRGVGMNKKYMTIFHLVILGLGFLIFSQSRADVNDYICGSLQNGYGPYDYRSDKDKLRIVEAYHLTPDVVNLVAGSTGEIGGDLDYTLRAFPNHHVALMAMVKLGEKQKKAKPTGAKYGVECYLQRAVRFRNDDEIVRIIYASYFSKAGKRAEALNQLNEAAQLGSDSANANYNIGIIYYDLKEYDKALTYAHEAYRFGFPLPGLRDKLKRARKWTEPAMQGDESVK
jgi:tetratricopeptide (TPR) repeat protein